MINVNKIIQSDFTGYFFSLAKSSYNFLITCLKLLIFAFIFNNTANVFAAETEPENVEEARGALEGITCESDGVIGLLRTEFAHTCISGSFFTFVVANIVSPGIYPTTLLRVNMNNDDISITKNACTKQNRVDYYDQKLSFSMCNNGKLAAEKLKAIPDILISFATGESWNEAMKAWNVPPSDYHLLFENIPSGKKGVMADITPPFVFPWKVITINDRICVATIGITGWIPIGCKYIKEPYPVSIHSGFFSPEAEEELNSLSSCSRMGDCYRRAHDNSKTSIVISSPIIECIKESISKLLISNAVCSLEDVELAAGSAARYSSSFFIFQQKMHVAVTALLSIYIILFGFKVILAGNIPPKSELILFVIKFLFVTYFSVGINISSESHNDLYRMDGMIQWVFPFLLNGMTEMASWVISASPSGLCDFSTETYSSSIKHLELWDSLDCRVSHYLGLDMVQTMIAEKAAREQNSASDILSAPIPPYLYLLIPAITSGNFTLIGLAIMYPLLVISVAAFVINMTVVCMISIVILGILAPIFVPMYLFDYTKGYFEGWMRLMISFMLQPMVAVVFMTVMLSVYDYGFYGTCKYTSTTTPIGSDPFILSQIGERDVKYFYVDEDWSNYPGGKDSQEAIGCRDSLGYILNNPFKFFPTFFKKQGEELTEEEEKNALVKKSKGAFMGWVESIFERMKKLVISMLVACFTLYLMKHFSELLAEFAADMTEGVSVGNMSIKPTTLYKAGMQAVKAGSNGGNGSPESGGSQEGKSDSGDKMSMGGGKRTDSGSKGGGDMISSGGKLKGGGSVGSAGSGGGSIPPGGGS